MAKEGYVAIYGSIEVALRQLIGILHEHSFAMVTEDSFQGWLKLRDFEKEATTEVTCNDGVIRTQSTAHFKTEEGNQWKVTTYRCPHPYDKSAEGWRFIDNVYLNDEEVACSLISVEEFIVVLKQRSKAKNN